MIRRAANKRRSGIALSIERTTMYDEVIDLLKAHEYFRGVSDAILGEIARFGTITNYEPAAVVHQLNDPLTTICFVLRGRLKTVRVDSRGNEHLFQMFERGDQYGMMLGGLGEPIPLRIFALEPSTVLTLDHEKSLELTLLYPELRRQWLQSYARSLRRRFLEPAAAQAPKVLAILHQSPATRNLAQKIIGRLQGLGEAVAVLSDAESWRSMPGLGFRSLSDDDRLIEVAEIRRQIVEWDQAKRIVVDITAAHKLDWAVLLRPADCALVFIRPNEIAPAIERLRGLEIASRGWRDKIAIVWVLEEGSGVVPVVPELQDFTSREFKICESPLPHPWGKVHSASMERLIHYLRGIKIGVALGGGAARGMAHLGVLNALDQNGIVVDMIAGTSVGAMTGVLYSAGLDCAYLASAFAADLNPPWIFRQLPSGGYWYLLYNYRTGQFDTKLRKYLRDWKLEQLAVPCLAVTADLVSGQAVVRNQGDAVQAILESINLPMLSAPICRNGQALVDGGVMNNIPADVLTSQGCNFVIAVSVTAKIARQFGANKPDTPTLSMRIPSSVQTLLRTLEVQNFSLNAIGVRPAEIVIEPEVVDFDLSEFMRARELFAVGEQAALVQVAKIQQLLARLDPTLFRLDPAILPTACETIPELQSA
jgi:predicted acylesterase/phospholipase RssA/CRP-like cAMP-binding protein